MCLLVQEEQGGDNQEATEVEGAYVHCCQNVNFKSILRLEKRTVVS
jgi:hypothetical protein